MHHLVVFGLEFQNGYQVERRQLGLAVGGEELAQRLRIVLQLSSLVQHALADDRHPSLLLALELQSPDRRLFGHLKLIRLLFVRMIHFDLEFLLHFSVVIVWQAWRFAMLTALKTQR